MSGQIVPVCPAHKEEEIGEMKCACGSTLEMLHGKFGVFFSCFNCGNMNMKKVLELNTIKPKRNNLNEPGTDDPAPIKKIERGKERTEITIRSDDPRYFD